VDGIIAPGNSIGTLTINGDYVQGATGVYRPRWPRAAAATSCT
jgi:hypothetical protein